MQIAEGPLLDDRNAPQQDGPSDARGDVSRAHILFVDDDWAGAAAGDTVFPGGSFGDNAFATIGDALLAAEKDLTFSEIEVRAGIYNEGVRIKRGDLTLRGVDRPVLRQPSTGNPVAETVVSIAASKVTVVGFEIDSGGNGISVSCPHDTVTIRDNHVHGMVNVGDSRGVGILVWGDCSKVVIRDNNVHDNDRQGIYLGNTDPSIVASDNTIRNNTISNNGRYSMGGQPGPDPYGIQVHFAERTVVQGNTISGQTLDYGSGAAGAGIWLSGSNNTLRDNDVSGCVDGIWVGWVQQTTTLTNNTLHENIRGMLFTDLWQGVALATDNIFCGNVNLGLRNNGGTEVDARRCWWANPAGANQGGEKTNGPVNSSDPLTSIPTLGPCSAP